uniref:Uncharacterized protein n=1 Tax=Ascaris lumbricoides TaxID=6252 RepID=A0A0M3I775_ASCLU
MSESVVVIGRSSIEICNRFSFHFLTCNPTGTLLLTQLL